MRPLFPSPFSKGVPAGMGFAAVLVLYVVGQSLKIMVQEIHANLPNNGAQSLRE